MPQGTEGLKSAADSAKPVITLSSGIVALTVAFAKEFKGPVSLRSRGSSRARGSSTA